MSRALQINSSPQGWMARNTKPVPLEEKGWVITMKKISIILLSAVLVFSSKADTMMTDRMNKLCELMGIPLIDHIIVGGDNREFFSFREKGMIDNPKITLSTDYRTLDIKSPLVAEQGKAR